MSRGRILVTGANGFIAAYCVAALLARGYAVVGTVRDTNKAQALLQAHKHHPQLTAALVPDITAADAFDRAMAGCDGVLHLASPFVYTCDDFERDMLLPSIRGTEAVCRAASRSPAASTVRRVVLTSSFAAVYDAAVGLAPGRVYTEADWSPLTYEDGKDAPAAPVAYRASKKLAEAAAWAFVDREKPAWDLVTLCPGMVFGPVWEGTLPSLAHLNASNQIVWGLVDAAAVPDTKAPLWTSVTELADAHIAALETPEAANVRFLVVNGNYDTQEIADIIHASGRLSAALIKRVPIGRPGERLAGKVYTSDSSKAVRILGVPLQRKLADEVVDLLRQLEAVEGKQSM